MIHRHTWTIVKNDNMLVQRAAVAADESMLSKLGSLLDLGVPNEDGFISSQQEVFNIKMHRGDRIVVTTLRRLSEVIKHITDLFEDHIEDSEKEIGRLLAELKAGQLGVLEYASNDEDEEDFNVRVDSLGALDWRILVNVK